MGALSHASAELPLCADLFGVCHGGRGALWSGAWWVDGDDEDFAVPSFCEGWIRSGYAPGDAIVIARKLLPDILSYDPRRPTSFPNNGRTLRDDVVDLFFSIYTNGKVAGDGVGPHGDLLDDFPYLGPPHESRRAERPALR